MLLSGGMLSLGGPGFCGKHSGSGIFGIGGGGADFNGGGMSSLLGGGVGRGDGASRRFGGRWRSGPNEDFNVCSGPIFPGVVCGDGAGIAVSGDGTFGCVVGISVSVSCTVISGAFEIDKASVSAITSSGASGSAFCRRILSTGW
jgi:hypothetical protein